MDKFARHTSVQKRKDFAPQPLGWLDFGPLVESATESNGKFANHNDHETLVSRLIERIRSL